MNGGINIVPNVNVGDEEEELMTFKEFREKLTHPTVSVVYGKDGLTQEIDRGNPVFDKCIVEGIRSRMVIVNGNSANSIVEVLLGAPISDNVGE